MIRRAFLLVVFALSAGFAVFWVLTSPNTEDAAAFAGIDADLDQGALVFYASGCSSCHSAPKASGAALLVLSGGREFPSPFGTFYAPNISSDVIAGIGDWSVVDLANALLHGTSPEGQHYYPAFPYTSYTRMAAEDVRALYAYLLSLPASEQPNRDHELSWFLRWRLAARVWKWLFFSAGEFQQHPEQSPLWNRGAYIVKALGHCGDCHTPRTVFGALRADLAYAGNTLGPEDELVPNITPHDGTGIGDWSRDDLKLFLEFGELPDGEYAAGSMDPVIEGLQHLTPDDRDALIDYLRALPPIENRIGD